ncbi:diacylglycerol kinase [Mergibacter septicus]|uniref:Periplasmic nitrate reductase, electron transfer subunit n=1 Tax=Mergibacter septicus TaxID=221402 RepID=A0A8E3MFV7_9PAST|nr:nitrate reductase cytochrome c-type subunit [Mergibacter septicus]AWX14847.1 diacylglycerol kinase [Mergibacter septicus]QDJ13477.1 diacylglycerol kinase [Mergibacter septicus]QDJ14099.1 diacylglycerol kinase [Mergibacter septicus]UTU48451.1 nitrate reductase cytochrome c-type subunit [Mergibacter septicus]WMR95920.1 nitrate reductase cytochrome c-type subunit [Mergibacter septicus]
MNKTIKAILFATMFVGMSAVAAINPNNSILEKKGVELAKASENVAPAYHQVPKYQEEDPLNYVNQPPLIPHSVAGMQVTKNVNQCLDCHSPENSRVTGATRISPTHFAGRDGELQATTSPRRYFCLQCHVPQTNAKPIVGNDFKPVSGYGK